MPTSIRQQVFKLIREFLKDKSNGAYYSEIVNYLKSQMPTVPINTLHGSTWDFRKRILNGEEKDVVIPSRGLYILSKYYIGGKEPEIKSKVKIREKDFYEKFAEYLVNQLEECTKAIPLGGNVFQDKWGTPDVLGIYKFSEADPIKPPIEIVSAEIKLDLNQLITAFGQACSYKIFSHKVYLVVPGEAKSDISRIESLCMRFGIGLIVFNSEDADNPNFQIRTRAIKSEPDYYFVNYYIRKIPEEKIKKLLG